MADPELTKDEEWLLRFLNENTGAAGQKRNMEVRPEYLNNLEKAPPLVRDVYAELNGERFNVAARQLKELGLFESVSVFVREGDGHGPTPPNGKTINCSSLTTKGRQHARRLANPDILDQFQQWARHHRVTAYAIIATIVLGALSGLVIAVVDLVNLIRQ